MAAREAEEALVEREQSGLKKLAMTVSVTPVTSVTRAMTVDAACVTRAMTVSVTPVTCVTCAMTVSVAEEEG